MLRRQAFATALILTFALCGACEDESTTPTDTGGSDPGAETTGEPDASGEPDEATPEPDEGPAEPACNHIAQSGCAEGENCTFTTGSDTASCQPEGTLAYGAECGGGESCERGICLNLNDTKYLCYQFCKIDAHCGDSECLGLTDAPYSVCKEADIYDNCDLLAQDCEGGKGCYVISGEDQPVCLPAGSSTAGGSCADGPSDCAPGFTCINNVCYTLCNVADPQECEGTFAKCSSHYGNAGYCEE